MKYNGVADFRSYPVVSFVTNRLPHKCDEHFDQMGYKLDIIQLVRSQ